MSSVGTALRKSGRIGMTLVMLATVITAWTAGSALATHQPADKPFAAASKIERFDPGASKILLTATVKNSKPTDMILLVSMECAIVTDTILTGGSTVRRESTRAEGAIRAWIEVDGQTVPVVSSSSPPQSPAPGTPNNEAGKVTFCNRVFERTVEDREENEGGTPGGDGTDYSRDYIATKDSNAFNWVRLNMGSGVHTIVLKADATAQASGTTGIPPTSAPTSSIADAYVGTRSMIGIPGKFANDAVINEVATG